MKGTMPAFTILAALAVLTTGPVGGQEKIAIDRSPLSFRDSGLYSNLNSIHGVDPATDGTQNLLTFERATSPDTPWDFYIMQYNATEPSPELAARLREFARQGKKIILRVLLGKDGQVLDTEIAKQRLEDLFQETDPDWIYAITLDEENVYWHGNEPRLVELYHYAKERWPELPVYQWWTPMIAPEVNATSGWVALPADGWVMDLYGRHAEEFEKKTLKFLETGKPLVHIAWASPTWIFHDREGFTKDDWWEQAGRPVFDDQVRICREYNVPVAYFCTQQAEVVDGKRVAPIRWGWHAVDPTTRRWFLELDAIVSEFDHLPDEAIGFRVPTESKFAWAHASSAPSIRFNLDERDRKRLTWRTGFPGAATEPGAHDVPAPRENPYARLSYTLDASATDLVDGLALGSVDGRVAAVPIVFRVEPLKSMADWQVAVGVTSVRPLGGSVQVSVSGDGESWVDAAASDPEGASTQVLAVDPAQTSDIPAGGPLWVRVELRASAGVKTNIASSITYLEVSASLTPDE